MSRSVTFLIAMPLGPDVPPWQMRWARRPGITPPDTFGSLSIATERWSEPGCGYTLESSRPHSPPVRPATVLGKHKVVCLFGPRTTIIHAFFVHSSLNLAQCVSVRVDTPLDGAQCWHARSSTERTHLLQHRSRHTPPRASYSQGARAGAMAPHPTPSQHGGSCERQPPAASSMLPHSPVLVRSVLQARSLTPLLPVSYQYAECDLEPPHSPHLLKLASHSRLQR